MEDVLSGKMCWVGRCVGWEDLLGGKMWKMCWLGRGEEKTRGALSRSSCFSLVFGTGHQPIIEQTPAEVKFCSPIKRKIGDSCHLMRI